ncbi:hypothetical protein SAMN05444678_1251, partial [Sphingomonas sp. YR710]
MAGTGGFPLGGVPVPFGCWILSSHEPAIDDDGLPCDEGGVVGSEESGDGA